MSSAARLLDLASALELVEPLEPEDARQVAKIVRRHAERGAAQRKRKLERDDLIRQAVREHFPQLKPWPQALELAAAMANYQRCGWPRDKGEEKNGHPHGTLRASLFGIFQIEPRALTDRHIHRILTID